MSPYFIAFIGYSLLAIAAVFPLVLHLSTTVPHDAGDPLLSAALLWWNAHTVPLTAHWWNGFAFYPANGMLAFSDSRLGEALVAAPLMWMGLTPIVAYNITLLSTYVLSAIAAHWFAYGLTRRHDAAAICGLAYGFAPFRVAHIQHLELLGGFAMPVALGALHRFREGREIRWLALFSAALILQVLLTSYYAVFFAVLLALWLIWFIDVHDWRALAAIGVAALAAAVAVAPIAIGYVRVHSQYAFERSFREIVSLSGDVTSLALASPLVALWGWTDRWIGFRPENELFPGVATPLLAATGALIVWRRNRRETESRPHPAMWLLPLAAVLAALAVAGWVWSPWRIDLGLVHVASNAPYKPFSLALVALTAWVALAPAVRRAFTHGSPIAFYLVATAVMFICAAGPKPTFAGHQIFYKPPYEWLMHIPPFESIRVPARFTMLAALTLSAAAALAFDRLRLNPSTRRLAALALSVAVLSDGWVFGMPLATIPDTWPARHAEGFAAVLELPLGDPFGDLAAMFRATSHHRPVINGASGFEPTHYFTLRTGIDEHDPSAFDGLPSHGRTLVVVDNHHDVDGVLFAFLRDHPRATLVDRDERWSFFSLDPLPPQPPPSCDVDRAPIVAAHDARGAIDLRRLTDGDPHTWWTTPRGQQAGDSVTVELADEICPCELRMALGEFRANYPRLLTIDTSADGTVWQAAATTRAAGLTMRASLEDPRAVTLRIPLAAARARFVRLRVGESVPVPWMMTELSVVGVKSGESGRLTPSRASTSARPESAASSPVTPCTCRSPA